MYNVQPSSDSEEAYYDALEAPRPPILSSQTRGHSYPAHRTNNFATNEVPTRTGTELRPVSELPDVFRGIFKFGVFNAIQSACFDDIMKSDENLVISSPTGSGKTTLFELAILKMLMESTSTSTMDRCVYIAPTKALCSEKQRDWAAKFGPLGYKCCELTGDTPSWSKHTWGDAPSSSLIVTTGEKWDSLTRSWDEHSGILSTIKLFLVDEVHLLNESRGGTLEVVVSRMKLHCPRVRFLMVSATVPNIADVAQWVGSVHEARNPAKTFEFGEQYRPCQLSRFVHAFPKKGMNQFAFANVLDLQLFQVLAMHSKGKPTLVFVSTRKGVFSTAEQLLKDYAAAERERKQLPWTQYRKVSHTFQDRKLSELAAHGVGVHHAGLSFEDRRAVEESFLDGTLQVLVATSTLAVGVNLPAHTVVIKGVWCYQDQAMVEYSDLSIMQMLGRAGRPQFDTEGTAIIMCESELESKYQALASGTTPLESCLHKNLLEHLNSEIGLGTIHSLSSAKAWLHTTFFFQRIQKNPGFYAIGKEENQSWKSKLDDLVTQSLGSLRADLLISTEDDDDSDSVTSTDLGDVMSKFFVRYGTMKLILALPQSPSLKDVLMTLSTAEEIVPTCLRVSEKKILSKLLKHPDMRFPLRQVDKPFHKPFVLLQAILALIPLNTPEYRSSDCHPHLDAMGALKSATRIISAIVEVGIVRNSGALIKHGLELSRCFNAKGWEDRPTVLAQITSIGEKSVKVLAEHGITTLEILGRQSSARLEILLNRRPPFGHEVLSFVQNLPRYKVTIAQKGYRPSYAGVEVELEVECSLEVPLSGSSVSKKSKGPRLGMTDILTLTSDLDLVDFRRTSTKILNNGKTFTVKASLTRPSQSVVVQASSTSVAGTLAVVTFKPNVPASKFHVLDTRPPSSMDLDLEGLENCSQLWDIDDFLDENAATSIVKQEATQVDIPKEKKVTPPMQSPLKQKAPAPQVPKQKPSAAPPAPAKQRNTTARVDRRLKRPNDRYECAHTCKDKTKCRHLCCREGLEKPPRQKPSDNVKSSGEKDATQTTLKTAPSHSTLSKNSSLSVEASSPKPTRVSLGLKPKPELNFDIKFEDLGDIPRTVSPVFVDDDLPSFNVACQTLDAPGSDPEDAVLIVDTMNLDPPIRSIAAQQLFSPQASDHDMSGQDLSLSPPPPETHFDDTFVDYSRISSSGRKRLRSEISLESSPKRPKRAPLFLSSDPEESVYSNSSNRLEEWLDSSEFDFISVTQDTSAPPSEIQTQEDPPTHRHLEQTYPRSPLAQKQHGERPFVHTPERPFVQKLERLPSQKPVSERVLVDSQPKAHQATKTILEKEERNEFTDFLDELESMVNDNGELVLT